MTACVRATIQQDGLSEGVGEVVGRRSLQLNLSERTCTGGKELARLPWFAPVTRKVFGGKFDPIKLRFPRNLIPALKRMPASDIRNWDAIRARASDLAAKL